MGYEEHRVGREVQAVDQIVRELRKASGQES